MNEPIHDELRPGSHVWHMCPCDGCAEHRRELERERDEDDRYLQGANDSEREREQA